MKAKRALVAGLFLFSLSGCMGENKIPMISYDQDGNAVQVMVSEGEYSEHVTQMISSVQDSAAPVLSKTASSPSWMLRTIVVGTGVNMEIGVDPIVKVGVYPRFRMVFSNSTDPTLP